MTPQGDVIDLKFRAALPTMEEWPQVDPDHIIEIGQELWNPTQHHDDVVI